MSAPENQSKPLSEVTYAPDFISRTGIGIWRHMITELIQSRGLIWALMRRRISAQFRESWLGYFWALLPPIVGAAAFTFMAKKQILPIGETPVPYLLFAMWGLGIWQLFNGVYYASTSALDSAGSMVARIRFPRETLVFATVGMPLINFAIRCVMVAILLFWFKIVPAATVWLLPLVLLPLVLFSLGVGMFMCIISITGSDFRRMVGLMLNFGLVLTPVIYPPAVTWPYCLLNFFNPVAAILNASRDLMFRGSLSEPDAYLFACLLCVLIFCVSWRFFHVAMYRVAERF